MNESLHISQLAIDELIIARESLRLLPYKDKAGRDTIYYGHLIQEGDVFNYTKSDADSYLLRDLKSAEEKVKMRIVVPLTQGKFDALVSLTYEIPSAIYDGTIDDRINKGASESEIRAVWMAYTKIFQNGTYVESDFLKKFREKELNDFFFRHLQKPSLMPSLVTSQTSRITHYEQLLHGSGLPFSFRESYLSLIE